MLLPEDCRLVSNPAVTCGLRPVVVSGLPAASMVGTAAIHQVVAGIAPVGAQAVPTPAVQLLPSNIAQALVGKEPGKFGGTAEEWSTWRMKWHGYIREVEELYPTLSSRQTLSMLRHWLDDATAALLDYEMDAEPGLLYEVYWAKLDLSFGAEDKEVLRRTLKSTRLNSRGKLDERSWREFESKLLRLARQLGDVTEVEIGRLMVDALPPQPWRRKLAEEADKKTHAKRLVLSGVPKSMNEHQVALLVEAETGRRPVDVYSSNDGYKIKAQDEEHRNTIKMVFDRQTMKNGCTLLVAPEVQELSCTEISILMLRLLRLDQKISLVASGGQMHQEQRPQDPPRLRPRFQRKLVVDEADSPEESAGEEVEVAEVQRPTEKKRGTTPPSKTLKQTAKGGSPPPAGGGGVIPRLLQVWT